MQLSSDTENVLDFLDASSEHGLRKRNDLGVLFELSAESGAVEEMNGLLFHGTRLYNLYHTLRRAGAGAEGYDRLQKEFTDAVEQVRDLIARTLVNADREQVERFETTYYGMTQGSLRNLVDLAHDLGIAKHVQNDSKRGSQNDEA